MTAYQPPALLEYTWGEETLRFELTPDGAGCLLVFTNVVDGPGTAEAVRSGWPMRSAEPSVFELLAEPDRRILDSSANANARPASSSNTSSSPSPRCRST